MSELKEKPIILVTNDDGVNAKGIKALVEMVKGLGEIYLPIVLILENQIP